MCARVVRLSSAEHSRAGAPLQVPLLRHRGEGDVAVLRRDVLQEGGGVGERDGQEGGHQADSGIFTALQAGDAAARVPKCQRPKFARQPARGEGKQHF